MPAFAAAVGLGFRYVETDVHATADGVLVAFHDDRLDRVTDRSGPIAALPYAEVFRARVAGREPIPRFDELLDAWPDLRINVEPKGDGAVEPLVGAIRAHRALDRVCVASFSGSRLARLREALGPGLCSSLEPRGIAAIRFGAWGVPGLLAGAARSGATCVQVPPRSRGLPLAEPRFVRAAHALGFPVHVWTVDDAASMDALLDLGIDGIMSDRPAVLKAVLERRGEWA